MQWDIRQQGCIQSPCLLGSSNLRSVDNSHYNDGHRNIPIIFLRDDAADDDDNDVENDDETAESADNDYSIYWKKDEADDEPVDNDQRNLLLTGELGFPALTKEPGEDFDQRWSRWSEMMPNIIFIRYH